MDLEKIKSFIQLAKDEGVKELSYESNKVTIKVKMPFSENLIATNYSPVAEMQALTEKDDSSKLNNKASVSEHYEVKSPFVGTFYSSPAPDKPAYVDVGSKVKKGQVLCILEAMKIMNEIDSEINGEIVEICVENESYVEFGQVLYRVKKS